jgi:ferredoxin
MDYWNGFCNFECTRCMDVCPTGALLPIEIETKKLTQLGIAKFMKDNCIVHTEKTDCGACSEHCPTKAVKMVPYEEDERLVIPEVEDKICIGCGACEFACPTTPYKAIFVDGNSIHKIAEKPKEEAIQKSVDEDFPF